MKYKIIDDKRQIRDVYIDELNNEICNNLHELIEKNERYYKKTTEEIAKDVIKNENVKFIMLAGPSSSGKTTTGKIICDALKQKGKVCNQVSIDDFYIDRDKTPRLANGDPDYDSVNSIDWELFGKCVSELLTKHESILPTFDFVTGVKNFNKKLTLNENDIILIEGLHAINPIVNKFIPEKFSAKIYLSPESSFIDANGNKVITNLELRFARRIIRDEYMRLFSAERTVMVWKNVRDAEIEYIEPYKNTADYVINTALYYETGIYSYIFSRLNFDSEVVNNLKAKFLNIMPINPNVIPANSMLFEFIVKGETYTKRPECAD